MQSNSSASNRERITAQKQQGPTLFETAGIGIRGMWLLAMYPLLVWLVIGTLGSYGFQGKVSAQDLTIPAVMQTSDHLARLDVRKDDLTAGLLQVKALVAGEQGRQAELAAARGRLVEALVKHQEEVSSAEPPNFGNETFLEQYATLLGDIPEVAGAWRAYTERAKAKADLDARAEALQAELDQVLAQQEQVAHEGKVNDLMAELEFMRMFGYRRFAIMPDQLLTLVLTLSMGALGSLIYLTRNYLGPEVNRPFSWYLFRPFLGMVTAISVFVLAKAGQLTITDASLTDNTSENLNPYFISFLAIISGLLAEQAIERIRNTGVRFFGVDDRPEDRARWAIGIEDRIQARGQGRDDLLDYLPGAAATLDAWLAGTQPVPAAAQRIIAAWLGVPQRTIFTDLPPATTEDKQAAGDAEEGVLRGRDPRASGDRNPL